MTEVLHGTSTGADTRNERAQKAVKAFRALQPTLSAYARAYTGRKNVRVEISAESPRTDGDRILFRPPMELGDLTPHVRKLCDKRDDIGRPLCNACGIRERVLIKLYHEIAHISEGSFDKPDERRLKEAITEAVKEHGTKFAKEIEARLNEPRSKYAVSYMALSNIVSPFLPQIVNALEDARVNRNMFESRRGTKIMFDALLSDIFAEGVEQGVDPATGEAVVKKWADYPLNAQIITGLFTEAAGYVGHDWYAPVVIKALADPELHELIESNKQAKHAGDTYDLAFPILARLRELGFCKSDKDPEDEEPQDEPEPQQQPDEQAGEDSDAGEASENSSDDSGESRDDASADEADGTDSDDAGGSDESRDGTEDRQDGSDRGGSEQDSDDYSEADQDLGDDSSDGDSSEERSDGDNGPAGTPEQDADQSESDGAGDAEDRRPESGDASPDEDGDDASSDGGDEGVDEAGESDSSDNGESAQGDGGADVPNDSSADNGQPESGSGEQGVNGEGQEVSEQGPALSDDSGSAGQPGDAGTDTEGDQSGDGRDAPSSDVHDSVTGEHGDSRDEVDTESSATEGPQEREVESAEGGISDTGQSLQPDSGDSGSDDRDSQEPDRDAEGEREAGDEVEPVDTGADQGMGGLEIPENAEMGEPDDVGGILDSVMGHVEEGQTAESVKDEAAVQTAVVQGLYFETPSVQVTSVRINHHGKPSGPGRDNAWEVYEDVDEGTRVSHGTSGEFDPDESIMGPALLKMRRVFADNRRAKVTRNLKSGKVNAKVLGKRAPVADPRLFKHHSMPGKKDYSVVLGMDISGSTVGVNIGLEKRAVMAQANLLARMGIDFAIVAHSALAARGDTWGDKPGATLDIYMVKEFNDPWSEPIKQRLRALGPYSGNLDGHALEFMRKLVERTTTTDKVIMYYSDGKMPAMNHDEELEILQREIKYCQRRGISLLGVGIRTDSPSRHGLDTVQVEEDRDINKVVVHLEKHLL